MSGPTTRALALLNLLHTHRHWSGSELAERLGVTQRTVRRDVDRLRGLGYRIDSVPGALGGYRMANRSALPPLLLTSDEAVAIAVGLRIAATERLLGGSETTQSAMAKVEQMLPPLLRGQVNALAQAVQPTGQRQGVPVSTDVLGELAIACRDRERIRFHYVAGDGASTERSVEPYLLAPAERHWYLLGWDLDRDDWRTFRVDRLDQVWHTRMTFTARALVPERLAVSSGWS